MKTPDDIKKGLECCINDSFGCSEKCPYFNSLSNGVDCAVKMHSDSFAYIQQLERERDAAVEAIEHTCATCKHYYYNSADGSDCKYDCLEGEDGCHNGNTRWEWRGVEEDEHAKTD